MVTTVWRKRGEGEWVATCCAEHGPGSGPIREWLLHSLILKHLWDTHLLWTSHFPHDSGAHTVSLAREKDSRPDHMTPCNPSTQESWISDLLVLWENLLQNRQTFKNISVFSHFCVVCVYLCVWICVVCVHVYVNACMHVYVHVCMYVGECVFYMHICALCGWKCMCECALCIYIWVYGFLHVCSRDCMLCMHVYVYLGVGVCVYMFVLFVCICACIHIYICGYVHVCLCWCVHLYVSIYEFMCVRMCVHVCMHTSM